MKENNDIIDTLPKAIFIIPMRGCPVFPGLFTTIEVSDKQDIDIIRHCEQYNGFGLVMLRNEGKDTRNLTEDDFYKVGTYVRVKNQINTIYGTRTYRIFAVLNHTVSDWDASTASFKDDNAFLKFVNRARKKAFYDTGIEVSETDHIITLITCDRSFGGVQGRLLVMGVEQ